MTLNLAPSPVVRYTGDPKPSSITMTVSSAPGVDQVMKGLERVDYLDGGYIRAQDKTDTYVFRVPREGSIRVTYDKE